MTPLKIAFVTSELTPFAKVGGLADVSAALPRQLHQFGHDVRVFLPLYQRVWDQGVPLEAVPGVGDVAVALGRHRYHFTLRRATLPGSDLQIHLVDCGDLYARPGVYTQDGDEHRRFLLLTRAAFESCQRMGWVPDILHCNDWQTAIAPLYLRSIYAWDRLFHGTKSVLTIHNIGYQGVLGADVIEDLDLRDSTSFLHQEDLRAGRVNLMKTGLLYADALTTVSPTYAREIQTAAYGVGLHEVLRTRRNALFGILNGVDETEWNPRTDTRIAARYSVKSLHRKGTNTTDLLASVGLPHEEGVPVIGIVSRLTMQKGIDLFPRVLPDLLAQRDLRFVALGSGEPQHEKFLNQLQARFPGKVCYYRGYSNDLAHKIEAGADIFLMPSLYEPCGLNQMYSLKYGTVPVVRRTGGLADTVQQWNPSTGEGNGFLFEHYNADALRWALSLALQVFPDHRAWRQIQKNGMERDFSWSTQAKKYIELYERLLARPRVVA